MRRYITSFILLLFIFTLFTSSCYAENIDISNLTYDDLLILRDKIELELFGRSLKDGVILPIGVYIGGIDIPVGIYILSSEPSEDYYLINFTLYEDETRKKVIDSENLRNSGTTMRIKIEEGMLLTFSAVGSGTLYLKSYSGLFAN